MNISTIFLIIFATYLFLLFLNKIFSKKNTTDSFETKEKLSTISKEEITKELLENCGIYSNSTLKQKKKPLSIETLKNINQNNEIYESDFEDEEDFIFTKVVGVLNKNEDGVERQIILQSCYQGEALFLERDIYNKVSNYAIKVCRMCNNEQIGYLSDSLAKKLRNREIERFIVIIKNITGGTIDKPTLGCNIKILFTA